MTDKYQPGTMFYVAVIGDVQQQLIEYLVLNPAVEYGDYGIQVEVLGPFQDQLYIYMLQLDRSFFL